MVEPTATCPGVNLDDELRTHKPAHVAEWRRRIGLGTGFAVSAGELLETRDVGPCGQICAAARSGAVKS
jgi:hypothetical protein